MTCMECTHFERCMQEASRMGQVFDPAYDGELYCAAFSPNAKPSPAQTRTEDYKKLVADLRKRGRAGGCALRYSGLFDEAADAIEELLKLTADI